MTMVYNRAGGPRIFNVKDGDQVRQVVLAPGQSAELEIADADSPVMKAWTDKGEVILGADAEREMRRATKGREDRAERIASLEKELAELKAAEAAAPGGSGASPAMKAPPAQFGGDGGPEQMPTVGGRSGDPTPKQEETSREGAKRRGDSEPTRGRKE